MPETEESLFQTEQPKEEPKPVSILPEALKGKSPEETYMLLKQEHERDMQEQAEALKQAQIPAAPVYEPPPAPTYQPPVQAPDTNYYADPEKFLKDEVNRRVAPLVQAQVQSNRNVAREVFQKTIPDDEWSKYRNEIEQFVGMVAPEAIAQDALGVYKSAHIFVRGKHLDEIVKERSKNVAKDAVREILAEAGIDDGKINSLFETPQPAQRSSLFQSNVGVVPQTAQARSFNPNAKPKVQLSDREKIVAQKFGMTPEEYRLWGEAEGGLK
jgi:hypothetical protein